jgi:cation transport ATPase
MNLSFVPPENYSAMKYYNIPETYTLRRELFWGTFALEALLFVLVLAMTAFSFYKAYNNINEDKIGLDEGPEGEGSPKD